MGTIRGLLPLRQGKAPRIGLILKGLARQPYAILGILAGLSSLKRQEHNRLTGRVYQPAKAGYFRWLPAPMKNSMGIDSIKLTREANKAVRPHCAISAGAGVPCAAAVTAAMIFF